MTDTPQSSSRSPQSGSQFPSKPGTDPAFRDASSSAPRGASRGATEIAAGDLLEKRIRASRRALWVERVWPRFWPPVAVLLLFVLASLAGLWLAVDGAVRIVLLTAFVIAGLAAFFPLVRVSAPTRDEAIRRLEVRSGVPHRPASAYDDTLRSTGDVATDARARKIWQTHRDRLAASFDRLRPGRPEPRVEKRDPYALRAALMLATTLVALFVWPVAGERLFSAFRTTAAAPTVDARIDAWVTPPHYTRKAPIMLASGPLQTLGSDQTRRVEVPAGSEVVLRIVGLPRDTITAGFRPDGAARDEEVALTPVGEDDAAASGTPDDGKARDGEKAVGNAPDPAAGAAPSTPPIAVGASEREAMADQIEFKTALRASGTLSLRYADDRLRGIRFEVTPDLPPEIRLTKPAAPSARGALTLNYAIEDDYGVVTAEATMALSARSRADAGITASSASSPWPAPSVTLKLPRRNARKIEAKTFKDLAEHPWAGLEVVMTLEATDQAPQVGRSAPHTFRLPARRFRKPLAKAIVEQRRLLAINPSRRGEVATALNALTIAPELFTPDRAVYLGLRSAYWRITHHPWTFFAPNERALVAASTTDADKGTASNAGKERAASTELEKKQAAAERTTALLKEVVDQLWSIALRVEDGDLSQAERDLRNAQERLSEALKNGATDEEISRLMEELREAMNRFLQSMQRQAQQNGQQQRQQQAQNQNQNQNGRQLSQRDLDQMLRDIENMAKSGARDAAQQMLDQLRDMMEQMQTAQGNPRSNQMQQQMRQFGDIVRNQQQLLDDTFNARQGRPRDGQPQSGQNGQQQQQGQRGQQGQRQPGQRGQQGQGQPGQRQAQGQRGQQGQRGRQGQQGQRGQRGQQGEGSQQGNQGRRGSQLSQRQGDLRDSLGQLMEGLRGTGAQAPRQLEQAQRAMEGAQRSLENGDLDRATRQQSEALEQLRQGSRQMAQQMMRGMTGQAGQQPRDPLGRNRDERNDGRVTGEGVEVPGEIDVQRARRILEELRRRASDPNRPSLELDYIERLLERF